MSRIYKTFKQDIPKMHFSSPKSKREIRAHSEFIDSIEFIKFLDLIRNYNIDTDIMLEAKGKDLALIKLVYELKFKENYCFIDETSFTI